jgi:prolyl-tRNA editing enzyme YbaK/EbsC (Cys-tRNA(Pro) deacylase)
MPEPLGPEDVGQALIRLGSNARVHHFDDHTSTSQDAARVLGILLGQIAKSLCFLGGDAPFLVVTSGDTKVLEARIAKELGIGRKKIKIAKPYQCVEIFGYLPGGVPPVGLRDPEIPVYVDRSLSRYDVVWAAGGSPHDNFPTSFGTLLELTGGVAVEWAEVFT